MEKSILEALRGENGNYLLPFFWQHGESESVLREEIAKIQECGIEAFCVEARPHPDFCGDGWWHDMDIILDEAKKRGMKVWILDDAHFPTGYANGALAKGNADKTKQYLKFNEVIVVGPLPGARFNVGSLLNPPAMPSMGFDLSAMMSNGLVSPELPKDDFLFAAVARRMERDGSLGEAVLLDEYISDGVLTWDVPGGEWRVFFIVVSRTGGGRASYLNWADAESAALQISAVYEPHWEHYSAEFGKTIAGFFSDEPCIDNCVGFMFNEDIGRNDMALPYSEELISALRKSLGGTFEEDLPALWRETSDRAHTAEVRRAYMDALTRLIERNFSRAIGDWCAERGVEYIGHIIEDENQHARLGSSMGHFFRALRGQHMSGIDDIGGQVTFGGGSGRRAGFFSDRDCEFYHYALGKLGSSLGHIDPRKEGRTMCEIFGAYGWSEGTRLMKYLADHFLVRGTNRFVPHAFSPMEYPDPDCPPHFYARGNNPLYRPFGLLARYMNRMCHILSGGTHRCRAAILYHGESQWMGDVQFMQKPARALAERQIDFDFLPSDVWDDREGYPHSFDGRLHVADEVYDCLIIPGCDYVPYHAARFAAEAAKSGFAVYITERMPLGVLGGSTEENAAAFEGLRAAEVVPTDALADILIKKGLAEVTPDRFFPDLRVYHYEKGDHLYMLSNESAGDVFDGEVFFPVSGTPVIYDGYENVLRAADFREGDGGVSVRLRLEPYESVIVDFAEDAIGLVARTPKLTGSSLTLSGEWTVAFASAKEYPTFSGAIRMTELQNLEVLKPGFAGTARYELDFTLDRAHDDAVLELPEAFEFAEVWINGEKAGSRIAPPYRFNCSGRLVSGRNHIAIEVTNTLANAMSGAAPSYFTGAEFTVPSGLLRDPVLKF